MFDGFLIQKYTLCVSTEILLEYEEKFDQFWGAEVAHNLLGTILTAKNTSLHDIFYLFHLVHGDVDDNKFADTFLSSNTDILVSNDKDLIALNQNDFPPMRVMKLEEFSELLATPV